MKKLLTISALLLSSSLFAQPILKEDIDIFQSLYGKEKKELVGSYMNLTGLQAETFWKMYDEYEIERKALGKKKMEIVNTYATDYTSMTDLQADEIVSATLKNNMEYDKLISKYYKKSKSVIGAMNAAKFIQLEAYMQTEMRAAIQESIPFIGEIDRAKPHVH